MQHSLQLPEHDVPGGGQVVVVAVVVVVVVVTGVGNTHAHGVGAAERDGANDGLVTGEALGMSEVLGALVGGWTQTLFPLP